MPSSCRPLPVVAPQSISALPDAPRNNTADWRRPPAPNASLVPTNVISVTTPGRADSLGSPLVSASRPAPVGPGILRVEAPTREHAVARTTAVGDTLSGPDHDSRQPSSSAEARASANHVVAFEAHASRAGDAIGIEVGEVRWTKIRGEIFGKCADWFPGTG